MAGPASRTALLRGLCLPLIALALVPLLLSAAIALRYVRIQSDWPVARGVLSGRILQGSADRAVLVDAFEYEKDGAAQKCLWEDPWVAAIPLIQRARMAARERRWHPGVRTRLKLDPDGEHCRPAYGWPEAVRLELTGPLMLSLFFALGALFVWLAPRPPGGSDRP
jgi:hypothetical protein